MLEEIGETAHLIAWYKQDGERVEVGDPVCLLEVDKAAVVLDAWAAGTLRRLAQAGDRVTPAAEFARIDPPPHLL